MCFAAFTASTVSSIAAEESPGVVNSEFIFESAPFPECHASTVVETGGTIAAAWFGGTEERHPDVGIWFSRRSAEGWSAPVEVRNGVQNEKLRYPCWNPVLFQPKSGPLLLFYKVGPTPERWWGEMVTSVDGGKTWTNHSRLPEGFIGPVKNKPIELSNGDILGGSSTENKGWRVHFERLKFLAGGKPDWKMIGPIHDGRKIGAIQPSILQHKDGRLQAIGRTRQNKIFTTESSDDGATWSEMSLLELPNPNSGTDAVTLRDGRHLLVYNHSVGKRSQWDYGRSVLNVAVSDDGKSWKAAAVLEKHDTGEYSYPAVIQSADGLVHVTYTWQRKRIRHVTIDPSKLALKPIDNGVWPK
jgi:predicted neuraminidase